MGILRKLRKLRGIKQLFTIHIKLTAVMGDLCPLAEPTVLVAVMPWAAEGDEDIIFAEVPISTFMVTTLTTALFPCPAVWQLLTKGETQFYAINGALIAGVFDSNDKETL